MKYVIFWFGNTATDHPVLRYLKVCMMQALVVGMGLEWPEGEFEVPEDDCRVYGIHIPLERVFDFVRHVNGECGPDLTLADLGTVDYEDNGELGWSNEIAETLEREYKLAVQPLSTEEMG
jgi:hypothetical protein